MPVPAILAQYICDWKRLLYELLYDKTNETIYVPSKDSDQNEHLHSLINETIYVPSEDSDQNEHLHSLIRVIPVHSMTKTFCMTL